MLPAPRRRTRRALVFALIIASVLLAGAGASVVRADPKRLYLANDDHTDYFWSGDDVQYRAAFLSMLDYYMTQAETTATRPSDQRGRFNCDGSLWVWEYEHNKTANEFQRLVGHLRDGTITMPLNTAVLCYGGMPAEAVLRSMYYAGRLERRYDLRFPLVLAMENQTLPGGIASLWAGSGAQYSWRGVCGCATKTAYAPRPREIYRFLGPDSTGVVLKWNTKQTPGFVLGGYGEAAHPTDVVGFLDTDAGFQARWPWSVSAAFGFGEDHFQTTSDSILAAAQRLSNPNRRVIVSNEVDFFQDFLGEYGSQIPTFSGSFGNEWELLEASMGAVTGAFRRAVEKLRTAEALATVASLQNPGFMSGREPLRDAAFMAAGLYYEHDWTADGVVPRSRRAQFQRDQLAAFQAYVDPLYADGVAALGAAVPEPAGTERHAVFNPLSWSRSDVVDLVVGHAAPFRIVDVATGAEVPSQTMGPVAGGTRVRIVATNVPSVGYRVYEVQAAVPAGGPPAASVNGATIDNGIYRVTIGSRGQITSLVDHRNGDRQVVAANGSIHDLWSGNGQVSVESSGPVSVTLKATINGTPKRETRYTLYAGLDRLDLEGTVTQNFGNSLSYESDFALPGAVMRHEEVGMIAKVARAANGGDYADQNTRTDWLTFNHFVDLSQSTYGVTLSNADSPFFQAGNSTPGTLDTTTPTISACVGMQVDGTSLGIQNQDGDTQFPNHFALRTHGAWDPVGAMRFALEHQNPLVDAPLTGGSGTLPDTAWSLVSLGASDVLLWALKPAEEGIGSGIVARVWNLADAPRTLALSLPATGVLSATRTTHLETDLAPANVTAGVVSDPLRRQQMATYRLMPGFPPPPPNMPPVAMLLAPAAGFAASGDTLHLDGAASDDHDAPAALRRRWEVAVSRPARPDTTVFADSVAPSTCVLPVLADTTRIAWHVRWIVTDTGGLADTASTVLLPDVDLSPSPMTTSPSPAQDGVMLIVSFWIRNLGRMPAPATHWVLTVDGTLATEGDVTLGARDSVACNWALPAGSLVPGIHDLRLVADTLGQVAESDETDNVRLDPLPVFSGAPTAADPGMPRVLRLSAARPTPSSGAVAFELELPHAARVRWSVHDLQGRVVWSEARDRTAGRWNLRWTGTTALGHRAARGVYLARFDVGSTRFTRRLVIE